MNGNSPPTPVRRMPLVTIAAIIVTLYFGKDFFLPLVFAVLISFLLAPLIRRFEAWRLGRIGSVLIATVLSFMVIGGAAYIVAGQLIDLANQLPKYRENIRMKIASVKNREATPLDLATKNIKDITAEITAEKPAEPGPDGRTVISPRKAAPDAVPVQVVRRTHSALETLRAFIAPVFAPLGNAAVVIVFVIFMLISREDLRDRLIHLVGRGRLHVTTQAIDDAGRRVSRYLLAQLVVNASYGIPIGIGLHFIGVPNAALWGLLATFLRFIPYLGPWIAAAFPVFLSIAVFPTWTQPALTIALFIIIELISNNAVEPWLYGASTGLSPMAVIVSAVFWTWLWGAVGLILATPLTVCLAVLGKYIPSLSWLDILLGDTPPIATGDRLYQRLLAADEEEAVEIVENYVAAHSLTAAYEEVVLPAIRQADADCRGGVLEESRRHEIYQTVRRLLAELDDTPPPPPSASVPVLCLPASTEADELIAMMLAHLLEHRGIGASVGSSRSLSSEMVEQASESPAKIYCISALPPTSVMPATYLAKRIRARMPDAKLIVGLWHDAGEGDDRREQRLKRAQADAVYNTLEKASTEIALLAELKTTAAVPPAVPAAEAA